MTKDRALWLGETLRLEIRLTAWPSIVRWIEVPITRDDLLHATEADVAKRFVLPALKELKREFGLQPSRRRRRRTRAK